MLNSILTTLQLSIHKLTDEQTQFVRHLFQRRLPLQIQLSITPISDDVSIEQICEVAMRCYNTLAASKTPDLGLSQEVDTQKHDLARQLELSRQISEVKTLLAVLKTSRKRVNADVHFTVPAQYDNVNQTPNNNNPQRQFYNYSRPPRQQYRRPYYNQTRRPSFDQSYRNRGYRNQSQYSSYPKNYGFDYFIAGNNQQFPVCRLHQRYGNNCYACSGRRNNCQYFDFLEVSQPAQSG